MFKSLQYVTAKTFPLLLTVATASCRTSCMPLTTAKLPHYRRSFGMLISQQRRSDTAFEPFASTVVDDSAFFNGLVNMFIDIEAPFS